VFVLYPIGTFSYLLFHISPHSFYQSIGFLKMVWNFILKLVKWIKGYLIVETLNQSISYCFGFVFCFVCSNRGKHTRNRNRNKKHKEETSRSRIIPPFRCSLHIIWSKNLQFHWVVADRSVRFIIEIKQFGVI